MSNYYQKRNSIFFTIAFLCCITAAMKNLAAKISVFVLLFVSPFTAFACDYCSIYTQLEARHLNRNTLNLGATINLLGYSKTRLDGNSYQPGANQNHKISVVELEAAYDFNDRFSLQLDVPFIFQDHKRLVDDAFESASDEGIGDVALYGFLTAVDSNKEDTTFLLQFVTGVKGPTGSTDSLSEVPDAHLKNTGIYGSDLTLGTGSFDVPFALLVKGSIHRVTLGGELQYDLRTKGDFGYQYANDFRWDGWIGHLFTLEGDTTLEPRIHLNGLVKDHDSRYGNDILDSGQSFMNIGPQMVVHFGKQFDLSVEVDAPVSYDNDGLQSVVDHRVLIQAKGRI